ncbi:hypothetical protein [Streptacidiphilus fuscans]|uniref:Uncharacterized protein n=1 Tax=Streptacidiphilus fuscans TaxID=2789292 RepID=A0A931FE03_9ACTN|nr:hypothetical protein [Streptacidiphilus fuscans]MBF9070128.1 hypothetical protein [Streptacidiphilus fuscans]
MTVNTSSPLSPVVRRTLVVPRTVGAAYAALLLTLAPSHTDALFAWTMSPVTATLIGAGYAGSCAMLWLCAARARQWAQARVSVLSSSLFMLLMLVAILLDHGTLHLKGGQLLAVLAAYGWLGVHLLAPLSGAAALYAQRSGAPGERPGPLPWWVSLPTVSSGAFLTGLGGLLFTSPAWAVRNWPWTVGRLDIRVLAAFTLTFGIAMLLTVRDRELQRVRHGMVALVVTGLLGLAGLLRYADQVRWDSVGASGVVAVLMLLFGLGLSGLGLSVVLPRSLPTSARRRASPTAAPTAPLGTAGGPGSGAHNPA